MTSTHTVRAAQLRVSIAQGEFHRRYPAGTWLPYVHESFDALPQRIATLIDAGHPLSAEYWLLSAEKFAGVIDSETLARYVDALGPFELAS